MSRTVVRLIAFGSAVAALLVVAIAGAAPTTYSSGDVSLAVPDASSLSPIPSISVGDAGQIADVNVAVLLQEGGTGNLADIDVAVVAPDNTKVNLALDNGGIDSDYGSGADCNGAMTTFDDEAATSVDAAASPFDGAFQPEQPLSALDGKAANGTWKLEVADDTAGGGLATLLCWKLTITFAQSDLAVTLTDSADPAATGADLTYTATVTNGGPDASNPTTVVLALPAGATLVTLTPSQGSCDADTVPLTCDLGSLAPAGAATVAAVVTPGVAGTLVATATVSTGSSDVNPSNNTESESTTVQGQGSGLPTLTVTTNGTGRGVVKSDPAGISCGLTCTAGFTKDTSITLTATAADGSAFKGWGGACTAVAADSPCTVTAQGDLDVIATFTKTSSGGSGGSGSGQTGSGSKGSKFFACTITGTAKADVLRGTKKRDVICGLGGNDKIYGLRGNDVLIGGPGKDKLYGGKGNDEIYTKDSSQDAAYGGPGKDKVYLDLKDLFFGVEGFIL